MRITVSTDARACAYTPLEMAKLILKKRSLPEDFLEQAQSLSQLTAPFTFKNIERFCERLLQALQDQEVIGLICDHDCDGQSSCAILMSALQDIFNHPKEKILCFIGHRTEEGYGLTDKLKDRILAHEIRPTVMITADCGSSDEKNIAKLKEAGIAVLVTDHHHIPPQGPPESAYTVINPQQEGCFFPDKRIAGCAVAWLCLCALRAHALKKGAYVSAKSMASYLDFVAVGTLADCVSLTQSHNNRLFLRAGLSLIRQGSRPCWRVLQNHFNETLDSDFMVFKMIPLLNADGRLSDALGGIAFLIASNMVDAQECLALLLETNTHRKHLQKIQLERAKHLVDLSCPAQIINLAEQGHHGIHGVTASRLLEEYQQTTIIFSQIETPKGAPQILSGSARGIANICLKSLLDQVYRLEPDVFLRYGGHSQAAGLSIYADQFERFRKTFLDIYPKTNLTVVHSTVDVIVDGAYISQPEWLDRVYSVLEPFGKDFKKPLWGLWGTIITGRLMGADKNHIQLELQIDELGFPLKGLLFFCTQGRLHYEPYLGKRLFFVGELNKEIFRNKSTYVFLLKGFYYPEQKSWHTAQSEERCVLSLEQKIEEVSILDV